VQPAPTTARQTLARRDAEQARLTLRHILEVSGLTQRELARRLRDLGCGFDVPRVFSGRLAPRLHHILAVTAVLGLHPVEFFRMTYGEPARPSPMLQRLEDLIAPTRPRPRDAARAVDRAEFEQLCQRVDRLARRVEQVATGQVDHAGR
jgi:hypothetical protein